MPWLRAGIVQRCGGSACPPGGCDHRAAHAASSAVEPGRAAAEVPAIVGEVLRSPGEPLDPATRAAMGAAYGFDFSRVRVHAGPRAAASARALDAAAYTVGSHVVLRSGDPPGLGTKAGPSGEPPSRSPGWRLLAHELAHVVQQRGLPDDPDHLELGAPDDRHERQADAAAATLATGWAPPALSPLPARGRVQRQGLGDVHIAEEEAARMAAGAGMGDVKRVEPLLEEVARVLAGVEYQVGEGDTVLTVAKRFGTSADALVRANELHTQQLLTGQRLKVPRPAGCTLTVPSSTEAQMLAGAIFAEASPKAQTNDEREAIAWAFVNSARHVQRLCNGELECPNLSAAGRPVQCDRDRQSLGQTVEESIQRGSVAYNGPRWKLVMTGGALLPAGNLCTLPPGETPAMARAIEAAEAVLGGSATPRDYLRFNKASNQPPSPRMEKAGQHGDHTFYRFKPGRECG
jgi:LysM repeat protein